MVAAGCRMAHAPVSQSSPTQLQQMVSAWGHRLSCQVFQEKP